MRRALLPARLSIPRPPLRAVVRPSIAATRLASPSIWRSYASQATEQADQAVGTEQDTSQAEASSSSTATTETSALEQALAEKDKEIARLKDTLLRAVADYDNLQKTTARDKAHAKDFAIQNFARDLVANLDVVALALDSIKPEARHNQPELQSLWTGVEMTKSEVEKTLKRFGITPFDPTGQTFDPNLHEALYQAPVPGKEPGTVLECQKIGWMIKDRLLRPAQVGVVLGSQS